MSELCLWIDMLEYVNTELNHFNSVEKQLIHNTSISTAIQAIRRKNVLNMATLCKYEQELKKEYEYGKVEYDLTRSKIHEQKRDNYLKYIKEFNAFKNQFYAILKKYRRK
ncbi:hypothetical protein [Psychroserpens ponticola]|uniref:Uncharacterized protein n=1 Tax=Psychroserpens ponticola TaxID=2932268 RepID=A0ABY7S348_9FLAO|nr:hypothetical protein [Psychroserpens ponticola]WCO03392.1 hypothetical protein MUN68_007770 [Psychroserpens ponticola]